MARHVITRGLDLPISGKPSTEISAPSNSTQIGLLGHDYPTMKPRMHVAEGDEVKRGQLLFEDRKSVGVCFTAQGAGKVVAIHRGEKRKFLSLVIELNDAEQKGDLRDDDFTSFENYQPDSDPASLNRDQVKALISESGLWTAIRQRPFGRVPSTQATCAAIFITAIDTNPLGGSVEAIVAGQEEALNAGLIAVSKLTDGPTYLCVGPQWKVDTSSASEVSVEIFEGQHPAGLPGTHIHTLAPAGRARVVWHIGVQDVIAIGHLFLTGKLMPERIVALAGPIVNKPRLLRTRVGANIKELTTGELADNATEPRIISGSVLFGHIAQDDIHGFLNRYDSQICALSEDRERRFLGWLSPGSQIFSTIRAFISRWQPPKKFPMTTTTNGSHRAMVPIGMFERVMPLDIMPTFLLRALLVGDVERAEELGCLELIEEDLAVCTFVSPGKEDYAIALRNVLTEIWQEG